MVSGTSVEELLVGQLLWPADHAPLAENDVGLSKVCGATRTRRTNRAGHPRCLAYSRLLHILGRTRKFPISIEQSA